MLKKIDFGDNFIWGVAQASYQTEGAWNLDDKSPNVWDVFSHKKNKIERNENGDIATDFYHRYEEDINIVKKLGFNAFRFSLSWSRIIPNGIGSINPKGIDFYNRVIDFCLKNNVQPWITIYHWDHPQTLEDKGGWTNRDFVSWFEEFCDVVSRKFGDRVNNWMIMNEPFSFTVAGHFMGTMAPGRRGLKNFLPAVHHANLAQACGGRIVKNNLPNASIGTTHFFAHIEPASPRDTAGAKRVDAIINRLYIEPSLGLGYPTDTLPVAKKIYKYFKPNDEKLLQFDFDFIGLQYYMRVVIKNSFIIPYIGAKEVSAKKRNAPIINEMGAEVYPEGIYHIIKRLSKYQKIKKIFITENGVCFKDELDNGQINDLKRIDFFRQHLTQVLRAKNEGAPVEGYFVWSLTDNFEWDKGYRPRFGLVYIDYQDNLKRYIKNSGYWFAKLLQEGEVE